MAVHFLNHLKGLIGYLIIERAMGVKEGNGVHKGLANKFPKKINIFTNGIKMFYFFLFTIDLLTLTTTKIEGYNF